MDCKKIAGSAFSTNVLVPRGDFKVVAGTPKRYTKTADSGHEMTSAFCADCGCTLFRESAGMPEVTIVRQGCLDMDTQNQGKPGVELFARSRAAWVPELADATQNATMS